MRDDVKKITQEKIDSYPELVETLYNGGRIRDESKLRDYEEYQFSDGLTIEVNFSDNGKRLVSVAAFDYFSELNERYRFEYDSDGDEILRRVETHDLGNLVSSYEQHVGGPKGNFFFYEGEGVDENSLQKRSFGQVAAQFEHGAEALCKKHDVDLGDVLRGLAALGKKQNGPTQ